MTPALILSSDSHVFEPPDPWTTRIDKAFRDRAARMQRIEGADQLVVENHQIVSGIGLISNAGARFEAPETISALGRFEEVGARDSHPRRRRVVADNTLFHERWRESRVVLPIVPQRASEGG